MYKEKLKERERRRTVAREFGLIDAFFKVENPLKLHCLENISRNSKTPCHHSKKTS